MSDLLALAERVEKATGPDRELDWLIGDAVGARGCPSGGPLGGRLATPPPFAKVFVRGGRRYYDAVSHARYTASLDAAMTLVPDGWRWCIGNAGYCAVEPPSSDPSEPEPDSSRIMGKTPALALCAASLRALSDLLPKHIGDRHE